MKTIVDSIIHDDSKSDYLKKEKKKNT